MTWEEIIPHLNKLSKMNLKNQKRKVGWLVVGYEIETVTYLMLFIAWMCGQAEKILICRLSSGDKEQRSTAQPVPISEIISIRSCL
jgi:hypothetical protein